MAILTLGNNSVFVCMAEYAQEPGMFCCTCFKCTPDVLMAGTAVFIWHFFTISKCKRLMNLMTLHTICKLLSLTMGLMAIQTVRLISVLVMAECTVNFSMSTWGTVNLLHNTLMTGVTGRFQVAFKCYVEWLMGIRVTAETVVQAEMGFPFMTVSTFRYHGAFFDSGGVVAGMAFQTSQFGFMLSPGFFKLCDKCIVTFYTIIIFKFDIAKSICSLDADSQTCKYATTYCGHGEQS